MRQWRHSAAAHVFQMKKATPNPVGVKHDSEKPDYSLLPPHALEETVKALTYGKVKYSRENWRLLHDGENRYFAAAQRHLWALRRGETHDPESGLHHISHAIACMLFLYELEKNS